MTMDVIELLRVSTEEQARDDRAGIDRQKSSNESTIKRYNLNRVRTLLLTDVSGSNVLNTPEIKNLILLMKTGQIRGVVAAAFDRLIRPDNFDDYSLLQRFRETNTLIYLPNEIIDFNTQTGFLYGGINATISGNERRVILKRQQEGKEAKRCRGEHPQNDRSLPIGIGFKRIKDSRGSYYLTSQIHTVQKIFELKAERLNDCEISRRTGIHNRVVKNILQNPIYFGWRVHDTKRGKEKYYRIDGRQSDRKKVLREPDEIIVKKVLDTPPVDKELFAKVQTIVNEESIKYMTKREKYPHRFYYHGMLFCAECGEPIYSRSGMTVGKTDYLYCKKHYWLYKRELKEKIDKLRRHSVQNASEIDMLEAKIKTKCNSQYVSREDLYFTQDSFISDVLSKKDVLLALIKQQINDNGKIVTIQNELSMVKKELESLRKKRQRYLSLFGDAVFSKEELEKEIVPINEMIQHKDLLFQELRDRLNVASMMPDEDVLELLVNTFKEFHYLKYDQKRAILNKLGVKFKVLNGAIHGVTFKCQDVESATMRKFWAC